MNECEETPHLSRIWDIALGVIRTLRTPRVYDAWITVTDLYLHPYMLRRQPIYAKDLYQALNMLNGNIVPVEYNINANTRYIRATMSYAICVNGQYQ